MSRVVISAARALELYNSNPNLSGGFGEHFSRGCKALDLHHNDPKLASFTATFQLGQRNIQETVHGGALATLIDVITTVGILRMSPLRTISISLNTEFLRVIKVTDQVHIDTEVSKIGKNIVFTDCRIFTGEGKGLRLACKGQHTKSILADRWNFMEGVE